MSAGQVIVGYPAAVAAIFAVFGAIGLLAVVPALAQRGAAPAIRVVRPDPEPVEPSFEPSVGVEPNASYWIRGGIPVVSEDETPYEVRNRQTLCRCGQSRNKPFCDGSHKAYGFDDPAVPD